MSRLKSVLAILVVAGSVQAASIELDERPVGEREWGYRPAPDSVSAVNPPSFTWRPQKGIVSWELQCSRDDGAGAIEYSTSEVEYNVHCPPRSLPPGAYVWRYRGVGATGDATNWSRSRKFSVAPEAVAMPLPPRSEL